MRALVRRTAVLLATLLLLLSIGLPLLSFAEEPPKVVRVGWFPYSGYQETSTQGERSGYNYDYLMRIAQVTGWQYEFVEAEWSECIRMVQSGEIDLMGSILWSKEREKLFAFPDLDCGIAYTSLSVRKESDLSEKDFFKFDGLRVAGMEQTRCWADLDNFMKQRGLSYQPAPYPTLEQAMQAVQSGNADAVVYGGFPAQDGLRTVAHFAPSSFYFVTGMQNKAILSALNQAMTEIGLADPYFDSTLATRYNHQKPEGLYFTPTEQRYLDTAPELRVLCSGNWFPLEGFDEKTGQFYGMVPGVFEEISRSTGLRFAFFRADDLDAAEQKLSAGEGDLLSSFEGSWEEAGKLGVNLTDSYFSLPMMVVSNPDASPSAARIAAGMQPSLLDSETLAGRYQIQIYPSDALCIQALERGEVGQAVLNGYTANHCLSKGRATRWQVSQLQGMDLTLRIGVKQGSDPALLSILNKAISQLGEAQVNGIILKNTIRSEENPFIAAFNRMPVYVVLIFAGFLLLIILILARVIVNYSKGERTINALLYYDSLTGLLNQRGFEKEVRRILKNAPKTDCHILVHFDINSFEVYNSLYGFEAGDQLLKTIAGVISGIGGAEQPCARLASDNFVKLALAKDMAEMVKRTTILNQKINEVTGEQMVLISYGLYEIVDRGLSVSSMCDMASTAKRTIKGNYERFIGIYDEQMRYRQLDETRLISSMEQALAAGEFVPYYQPKYDIRTRRIAGAEALVRWVRPNGEIIPPARFVELFEKNGLIARIDRYIFRAVCKQMVSLREKGIEPVPVSVNFSRVHLFDESFAASLEEICKEYQVQPHLLEIELTESAFVVRSEILSRAIEDLHRVGFLVSMDDFGSGFSSLNMLKDMYFDVIKLDGGFLVETSETARGQKVIESILFLTKRLRLKTVAEGVETGEQLAMLEAHGCDLAQGYYFSRPVPAASFVQMLVEQSALVPEVARGLQDGWGFTEQGEEIGILEMREMLGAVSALYSITISANLTQNIYCLLECDRFSTRMFPTEGVFDELIAMGVSNVHPDDRQRYRETFSREALLAAHARGEKQVRMTVRQASGQLEGVRGETWVIFVEDFRSQDVLELTFFHTLDGE